MPLILSMSNSPYPFTRSMDTTQTVATTLMVALIYAPRAPRGVKNAQKQKSHQWLKQFLTWGRIRAPDKDSPTDGTDNCHHSHI